MMILDLVSAIPETLRNQKASGKERRGVDEEGGGRFLLPYMSKMIGLIALIKVAKEAMQANQQSYPSLLTQKWHKCYTVFLASFKIETQL